MTKLKSGVFPIHLETGRYKGLDEHKRICKICGSGVEDEVHFLFKCQGLKLTGKMYTREFKKYFPNYKHMTDRETERDVEARAFKVVC